MKTERRYRALELHRAEADPESRTVPLSFSSEEPVDRWFGTEILAHDAKSIRMARAKQGLPLLIGHDGGGLPVGRVESIRLAGKRLRGVARFANTPAGRDAFQAVADGVATDTSVAYFVHEMRLEQSGDSKETYRVTDWEPLEVSIVAVPADPSVGVNRSLEGSKMPEATPAGRTARIEETPNSYFEERESEADRIRRLGRMHRQAEFAEAFVENGRSLEEFRVALLERVAPNSPPLPAPPSHDPAGLGIPQRDLERFSLVRLVNALLTRDFRGAGFEREVCDLAARTLDRDAGGGAVVPLGALATGRRDISATGSALTGTDHLGGEFIDLLGQASVTARIGRALTGLRGNVSIPRMTSGSSGFWVSEDGEITESTPGFDSVTLTPRTCGGVVEITHQALRQSSPDVEMLVRTDLLRTVGAALDRAAFKGGQSNEPTGILETAGIGSVSTSGALLWQHISELIGDVAAADGLSGNLAFCTTPGVLAAMLRISKDAGSGQFLAEAAPRGSDAQGAVLGYPLYASSNVPSNLGGTANRHALIFGAWQDLLIGSWGAIEVLVDPYSNFRRGRVQVRALLLADVAVRHPESFSACEDIDPAA